MMADLKKVLGELKNDCDADIVAIISRNGIPIAYHAPEGTHMDTFATLSATILGAAEVIYSGLKKEKPSTVAINSGGGHMVGRGIGTKAILIVFSNMDVGEINGKMDQATDSIMEVLKYEH